MTAFAGVLQVRRDTEANWTASNPTLEAGEFGVETDTRAVKIGDGSTAWTSLPYALGKLDSYTPSWTNITVGSSANAGEYIEIGNLIFFTASLVTGASFAITGNPKVSFPVTAIAAPLPSQFKAWFRDAGVNNWEGMLGIGSSTTVSGEICALATNAAYATTAPLSSTIPFTWSTGSDSLIVSGWYVRA